MTAILLVSLLLDGTANAPVDFDNEVIPVLTKAGCNTGACHGAAIGRGGFKLSLYGGDPQFDYQSIVLDLEGRRVNPADPDRSLIVLKATEAINHGGGYRLEYEGAGVELLSRWIRGGAQRIQTKKLDRFQVAPQSFVAHKLGTEVQLRATAQLSDGSQADVTRWTVFTAEDSAAVAVDSETAVATLKRRGRHIVVARYLDQVVPIELLVPLSERPVDLAKEPRQSFIDDQVLSVLSTLRIPVSPIAGDEPFLRRVTLDLTGRLPTPEQRQAFLSAPRDTRRRQLVDQLLASAAFNEYWTMRFAQLLRIRSQPGDSQGALTYHNWLQQQLTKRVPYDQFARELLTALGDSHEVGQANFYRTVQGPREQAEFASELFMGNRLRCANCHNHPLDRWTQDDYHGLSAIFAKLKRGRVIEISSGGEVTHPRTGENARPRIPGERFLKDPQDGRGDFAAWLTAPENPYFAKAIVNRLWKALMGRGLVEPTDDLRATNPATHPALLNQLAADFVDHQYDLRHTLRRIALSATYARSAKSLPDNAADDRYYSHALTRPLQPEVLADAISDVVGIADRYGEQPLGTHAVALFDSKIESTALDVLGRCSREDTCESADATTGGLTRKLHMFNGPLLNRRIGDPDGRLARQLKNARGTDIVADFYIRALGRKPSSRERDFWKQQIAGANAREQQKILEDFVWSLLSCREFVTNH